MSERHSAINPKATQGVSKGRTLVLALGNPLRGDDGVGTVVIESLGRSTSLPLGVDLVDGGTPGLETALLLDGYQRAVIVDAAEIGRVPGTWARFSPAELGQAGDLALGGTLHSAGLAEAIALGQALNSLPSSITIYGIQPGKLDWSPGLSDPVRAAAEAVCAEILQEISSLQGCPESKDRNDNGKDSDH